MLRAQPREAYGGQSIRVYERAAVSTGDRGKGRQPIARSLGAMMLLFIGLDASD